MYFMGYVVVSLLGLCIDALLVIMLISAVMSWIAPANDHPVMRFVNTVTDFIVAPVRSLLMRFEFVRSFPLDLSFYLTSVLLVLLRTLIDTL
ncbi:MAG: YggT family protein [Clostridia bacterium]|nr:YggT family protein [Clostridia bacterium]MBQ4561767.1 YggT family protein [Clostridia bacterium]